MIENYFIFFHGCFDCSLSLSLLNSPTHFLSHPPCSPSLIPLLCLFLTTFPPLHPLSPHMHTYSLIKAQSILPWQLTSIRKKIAHQCLSDFNSWSSSLSLDINQFNATIFLLVHSLGPLVLIHFFLQALQ